MFPGVSFIRGIEGGQAAIEFKGREEYPVVARIASDAVAFMGLVTFGGKENTIYRVTMVITMVRFIILLSLISAGLSLLRALIALGIGFMAEPQAGHVRS